MNKIVVALWQPAPDEPTPAPMLLWRKLPKPVGRTIPPSPPQTPMQTAPRIGAEARIIEALAIPVFLVASEVAGSAVAARQRFTAAASIVAKLARIVISLVEISNSFSRPKEIF